MKFGTIGTSRITDKFLEAARTVAGLEHAAVYSRTPHSAKEFGERHGVSTVFTNLIQMAASDSIEAVYIASPNALHYEQSKLFLEHGKHVLCEKTIAASSAQVKELRQLARHKQLVYMEAIIMLHLPVRQKLKEAIKEIGNITSARFDYSHISSRYPAYLAGKTPNIFNPKLAAGSLMDLGVYCVYPALDFFGVPDRIFSAAGFLRTGADGYGSSLFLYKDKQVILNYSKVGNGRIGSEIVGDRGTITIGSISKLTDIKWFRNDGSEETIVTENVPNSSFMAGEALDFYRYAAAPETCEEEYKYAGELSEQVSEAMEIIREQAGIRLG